jgi:hypothetical protein
MLESITGLIVGTLIGVGFGIVQGAARKRNEKQFSADSVNAGWASMAGSGGRVAALLIALVIIQIICPLWFSEGTQWWVSAGVVAGYGFMLFRQLRRRVTTNR